MVMRMKISEILEYTEFRSFLNRAKTVKTLLIGDICTDIYWSCDMTKSRLSRETPHFPLPVVRERMSLGAGGNAAGCIKSLGVSDLSVIGVVRNDWRGECLRRLLAERGIPDDSVITERTGFTNAYIKPMKFGFSGEEVESAAALGKTPDRNADISEYALLAKELSDKMGSGVCMTVGDKGSITVNGSAKLIPAVAIKPPFDVVGAGDCFLSAFSTAVAAGCPFEKAALFGNMASSIVVKKIGTTGSASPEELETTYAEREVNSEKGIMNI